jgi:hypothetical protein
MSGHSIRGIAPARALRALRGGGAILALALAICFVTGCGGVELNEGETGGAADDLESADVTPGSTLAPVAAYISEGEPSEVTRDHPAPLAGKEQVLELCGGGEMVTNEVPVIAKEPGAAFTLELWARPDGIADQPLVRADHLTLETRGGQLHAVVGETELWAGPIVAHEWYHVALVVDQDSAQLFLNGGPRGSARLLADWRALRGSFRFGGRDGDTAFCGKMETIRLTRGALYRTFFTPEQLLHMHCNMIFGYDFDDQLGTSVQDQGPLKIDAELRGAASLVPGAI